MSIDQIINLIKNNEEAKNLFDKAIYWEKEAIKIDYVNKEDCTQQDIDDFNAVWANFRHYFDQIGINGAEYEEAKKVI